MSNMGRPKLDEPMVHKVSVRFNEREYQRLKVYAESINKTMTEALKDGIELLYKNSQEKE
ncbi:MAG: CopG family transcriptional regulator [Suilimivivens sp.]